MPIRPLNKEDMLANTQLGAICYNFAYNEEKSLENINKEAEPHKGYWGYFSDDNALQAALGAFEYDVHYQGKSCKMGGIGNVVSLPEARRGGKIRELFALALQDLYDKGIPFSTLYPFSHPYYEKFGYALALKILVYKVPIDSLPRTKQDMWAKQLTAKDDLSELVKVYNSFNANYSLSSCRSAEQWKKLLADNPYEQNTYAYLLGDEKGANAFILFSSKMEENDKNMFVHSIAFSSPQGLYNCFSFFYRFSGQFKHVVFESAANIPFSALIPEAYDLTVRYGNQPMVRVIDTQKVLNLLASEHMDASFTIKVIDAFFAPANGTWRVSGGKAEKDLNAQADCALSIQTFSQLAAGALTFEEALYKTDLIINRNHADLEAFFNCRPFLLTDVF